MSDDTRAPLPEALRQVERVLRDRTWPPSGATCRDCADVVARAIRYIDDGVITAALPEGTVAVPIAELEALRDAKKAAYATGTELPLRMREALRPLIARIPEPPRCAHDGPLNWLPSGKYQCVACSAVLVLREDDR